MITSGKEAGKIKYIGKSSVLKIDEFLATGQMEALNTIRAQKNQVGNSVWQPVVSVSMFNGTATVLLSFFSFSTPVAKLRSCAACPLAGHLSGTSLEAQGGSELHHRRQMRYKLQF